MYDTCTLPKKYIIAKKIRTGEFPLRDYGGPIKHLVCDFYRDEKWGEYRGCGFHMVIWGERLADNSIRIQEAVICQSLRAPAGLKFCDDYLAHKEAMD